ncbi:glycoside hydrolase family 43 protein [Paenibacillus nasutitermitis]|uniref:Glycosyl hydrolase family 43 n=1 Tax=Paenibacillus nasutitermitis TaxID=1652958 RepID=A0A916Z8D9_9BACL|nr:glycoside hydrolase family 43 protein [Paenibacillus nasutitermitis]GGD81334.1 glycosyl hydrolase family 43 [Paenibacillus nasutitermitis]
MKTLSEIHIRDPFILPVKEEGEGVYYLYGTTGKTAWSGQPSGFNVYRSRDLVNWDGPAPAFRPDDDFWSDHHYWAPEVHHYGNHYYMLASFKAEGISRATQILIAEHPQGPFRPHGQGPVTPADWECLDGTLFLDDAGSPWMVFCREWLQVTDGEMYAVRLTAELDGTIGEPQLLFHASEAPWSVGSPKGEYVTDGPFLHRLEDGGLVMLWSSQGSQGYAMGLARSQSGSIAGPWTQDAEPLFAKDGGHGMLFRDFSDRLLLTIHTPNSHPDERPVIIEVKEENRTLVIRDQGDEYLHR